MTLIGWETAHGHRLRRVEVEVRIENGRLSITSESGKSKQDGSYHMSRAGEPADFAGGQDRESPAAVTEFADGWDAEKRDRLLEVWERWHLNDMRAGCEHQRAAGWGERRIDGSKPANVYGLHFERQLHSTWNLLGWVRQDEHPDGLLARPCPECGYRYGTEWKREELPPEVVEFVQSL